MGVTSGSKIFARYARVTVIFAPLLQNPGYAPEWHRIHNFITVTLMHAGSVHTAVQSHRAKRDDELSIEKGTMVTVIWASDDGWWMVRYAVYQ